MDVALIDLGEGREWWQTRLLLLTAGSVRLGNPRVLVFLATVSGRSKQFVAWATPRELLRAHLTNASPELQLAYRRGQAQAAQWVLGEPIADNPRRSLFLGAARRNVGAARYAATPAGP